MVILPLLVVASSG